MAIRVKRNDLSEKQVEIIRNVLTLQAEVKGARGKWNKGPSKVPITFFQVVTVPGTLTIPSSSPGTVPSISPAITYVDLPYAIGNTIVGKAVNFELPKPKVSFQFNGKLRDEQPEVFREAWEQVTTKGTTSLRVPPGFGKTILGAKMAADLGRLTIVIYHQTTLETIWKNTFANFTNAKVWVVGEHKTIPTEADVILCMNTRVCALPEAYRLQIGTLIMDEAHRLCTESNVPVILSIRPYYVIAETATLNRTDGMESMIHAVCGTHAVIRNNAKAFAITKLITGIEPVVEKAADGNTKWSSVIDSLANNKKRNEMIVNMVLTRPQKKILILCRIKDHVNILNDMLKACGCSVDFMMGNKRKYQDSQILIGTISKIGTGFDEASFCESFNGIRIDLLILTASIKDPALLEQNVGRALRAQLPEVIHLFDKHPIITRHWAIAKKWYTENMGTLTTEDYKEQPIPARKITLNIIETTSSVVNVPVNNIVLNIQVPAVVLQDDSSTAKDLKILEGKK